jgi:hypothetical protein
MASEWALDQRAIQPGNGRRVAVQVFRWTQEPRPGSTYRAARRNYWRVMRKAKPVTAQPSLERVCGE